MMAPATKAKELFMNKYIKKGAVLLLVTVLLSALTVSAVPAVAEEAATSPAWYETYTLT